MLGFVHILVFASADSAGIHTTCGHAITQSVTSAAFCYKSPASFQTISGIFGFAEAGQAALFLRSSHAVMELHIDAQVTAAAFQRFSFIAFGTKLALENVSLTAAISQGGSVVGLLPWSSWTSVRNGRINVTHVDGEACGLAGELTGLVLLDSVYIHVEASTGAALALGAQNAKIQSMHCLFEEHFEEVWSMIATMGGGVQVDVWVDSYISNDNTNRNKIWDVLTERSSCEVAMIPDVTITSGTATGACFSAECANLRVKLQDVTFVAGFESPLPDVAVYRHIYIDGVGKVTSNQKPAMIYLLSRTAATELTCISIGVNITNSYVKTAMLLSDTTADATATNVFLKPVYVQNVITSGLSAFLTVSHSLSISNVMIQGAFNYGGSTSNAILVSQAMTPAVQLIVQKVIADIDNFKVGVNSSILIANVSAEATVSDASITLEQPSGTVYQYFGTVICNSTSIKLTIQRITVSYTFEKMPKSGFVTYNTEKGTVVNNATLAVNHIAAVANANNYAPFYYSRGDISNLKMKLSYNTAENAASIAYFKYGGEITNITINGSTDTSKTNQMTLMHTTSTDITLITNIEVTNFRQIAGGNSAIVVKNVLSNLDVKNLEVLLAFLQVGNSYLGALISLCTGEFAKYTFTDVTASGTLDFAQIAQPYSALTVAVSESGADSMLHLTNVKLSFTAVNGELQSVFGYYAVDRHKLQLTNVNIDVNGGQTPCFIKIANSFLPEILEGPLSQCLQ